MNQTKKPRGLFIVFEGIDRAGKLTQIDLLRDYFKNMLKYEVKVVKFPDREIPSGKMLDDFLKSPKRDNLRAAHQLFSFNRWEKREAILNELEQGNVVICNRYAFCSIAYSLSNGFEREFCFLNGFSLSKMVVVVKASFINLSKSFTKSFLFISSSSSSLLLSPIL